MIIHSFVHFFKCWCRLWNFLCTSLTCSTMPMLVGQGSHAAGGCSKDADCAKVVRCIDAHPICNLTNHQCICQQAPPANYGTKRVHKTHQNWFVIFMCKIEQWFMFFLFIRFNKDPLFSYWSCWKMVYVCSLWLLVICAMYFIFN